MPVDEVLTRTPAVAPARRCAYAVLRRVFEDGAWADRALRGEAERLGLDPRDPPPPPPPPPPPRPPARAPPDAAGAGSGGGVGGGGGGVVGGLFAPPLSSPPCG